jgi:type III secretory pathway component EscV
VFRYSAAAARRGESPDYAAELALDRSGPDYFDIRAGAASFATLEEWAKTNRRDLFRRNFYSITGVWIPPIRIHLDDDVEQGMWAVGFNRLQEPISEASDASEDKVEFAIAPWLFQQCAAVVGNRQVELLLHRLNQTQSLLVMNLLERYGIGAITEILRQLAEAQRSIRNLHAIAEVLVFLDGDVAREIREALLAGAAPHFWEERQTA